MTLLGYKYMCQIGCYYRNCDHDCKLYGQINGHNLKTLCNWTEYEKVI